jgi:hypothetical protein
MPVGEVAVSAGAGVGLIPVVGRGARGAVVGVVGGVCGGGQGGGCCNGLGEHVVCWVCWGLDGVGAMITGVGCG